MKKLILTLAAAMLCVGEALAAKAWPLPMTFVQSNGDTITVTLHGDEHFAWYTDMQGNVLSRQGNDFTIVAKAAEADTYLSKQMATTRATVLRKPVSGTNLLMHEGSPKVPVILVQFSDTTFTLPNPRASFEQYLNKTDGKPINLDNREDLNSTSIKRYFEVMSSGAFSPDFQVIGPVTLPNTLAYYGGSNANSPNDEKNNALLFDALNAVDDSVDLSVFDNDKDGKIDLVCLLYAGYSQSNGGYPESLWPKRFTGTNNSNYVYDGKTVAQGCMINELYRPGYKYINGIGLFVHEFSHCLGLPDLYNTNNVTKNNLAMEDWSVMDAGCYVNGGFRPVKYTAWEREAMGWDEIPALDVKAQQLTLDNAYTGGTNARKIVNPSNESEYYVLQYFENSGLNNYFARYESYTPNTRGLLIYHVDYNNSFSIDINRVNYNTSHPRMTVIPADGTLMAGNLANTQLEYCQQLNGDLFGSADSSAYVGTFTQSGGLPNAAWWTTANDQPLFNIKQTDGENRTNGTVSFDFITNGISTPFAPASESDRRIYAIDGRYMGTSIDALPHGIYIRGGKKFVK